MRTLKWLFLFSILVVAGCLPGAVKDEYLNRLETIERSQATLRQEAVDIEARLAAGGVTVDEYQLTKARIAEDYKATEAEAKAVMEELDRAKAGALEEGIAAAAVHVERVARIVETGAPTLGGIAGTFWPFAIFIGGIVGKLAGGIAAAAAALKKGQ